MPAHNLVVGEPGGQIGQGGALIGLQFAEIREGVSGFDQAVNVLAPVDSVPVRVGANP
jgi:hypothetical protein